MIYGCYVILEHLWCLRAACKDSFGVPLGAPAAVARGGPRLTLDSTGFEWGTTMVTGIPGPELLARFPLGNRGFRLA